MRERVLPPKNVVDKLEARLKAVSRSERWRDDLLFETQIKSFVAGLTTLTSCSHYCFNHGGLTFYISVSVIKALRLYKRQTVKCMNKSQFSLF